MTNLFDTREKLINMGYNPEPLTRDDWHCSWVRLVVDNKTYHIEYPEEVEIILRGFTN